MEIIRSFDNSRKDGLIEITFKFDSGREKKVELELDDWCEIYKAITYGQYQAWKREKKGNIISYHYEKSEDTIRYFREKYQNEVY